MRTITPPADLGPGDLSAPPEDGPTCELCGAPADRYCDVCVVRLDTPVEDLVAELAVRDDERRMAARMRDLLADLVDGGYLDPRDVWWLVDEWDCHADRIRGAGR